jgi:hypothetical protein
MEGLSVDFLGRASGSSRSPDAGLINKTTILSRSQGVASHKAQQLIRYNAFATKPMLSSLFRDLHKDLALFEQSGGETERLVRGMTNLFSAVQASFTFTAFELFQHYRHRAIRMCGDEIASRTPCFFTTDYLERGLAKDPSNYGIVLALGVKHLHLRDLKRARQLIQRVARSGYRERARAKHLHRKHFSNVHV